MNYIRHLSGFFTLVRKDARLSTSHISLYMALFQYWNFNRFENPFPVYRENIMRQSKIGSKNTYHKCIRELHEAQYIFHHPSPSKFLAVKVSMIRLDLPEVQVSKFRQLDLFNMDKPIAPCTDIGTNSVPILTAAGTDFDTVPVPVLGHTIKHKQIIKGSKQLPQNFDVNNQKKDKVNAGLRRVPKAVHHELPALAEIIIPSQEQVAAFFGEKNYPSVEANKFFNHYTSIGWKIKGITPVTDWNALAHKWMLNSAKYEPQGTAETKQAAPEGIQFLYQSFLKGQPVFKLIMPEHFYQLKLGITKTTLAEARLKRISQVAGTNQNALIQLWSAYLSEDENHVLVLKDRQTLIAVAQKLEVLKNFQEQKQNGIKILNI